MPFTVAGDGKNVTYRVPLKHRYKGPAKEPQTLCDLFPESAYGQHAHRISAACTAFMKRCLAEDSASRPTAKEALEDPWFAATARAAVIN